MRFLSVFAVFALFFPAIISADPAASSKCIDGASSALHRSPTGSENIYEAQFFTNEKYHQSDTKYPDYVDLHWSVRDNESKDGDNSVQSFVVRIAHDGQMEKASAVAVNQDGIYLNPGQTIRYWHSYSMNGQLCRTEAHSFNTNEKTEESKDAEKKDSTDAQKEAEKVKQSNREEPFQSQQVTPTMPPPATLPSPSPAIPMTPAPTVPTTPPPQQFPEPPATCANDEYFCQIYKNCYSCVANPNQALCTQCNNVFACADTNCRQKETCNLCKNYWNAYQSTTAATGPFVCSVVRGQC